MIKSIQLTCLMLLSGYLLAQAQQKNYNIEGHIFDEGDHLLPGATVFIPKLKEGVVMMLTRWGMQSMQSLQSMWGRWC